MAKIKKVKIGSTTYDLAVSGVDKVEGLEERLGKLEDGHSVDGNVLVIGADSTPSATTKAVVSKVHLEDGTYDIVDNVHQNIIVLADNSTTTAGTWLAKTDRITTYADGQVFIYKITKAGASTTTLNITGSAGTALGAKTIYRSGTSKLSTHYGVGQYLLLAYNSTNDCFRVINDYDANTNATHSGIGICSTAASTAAKAVTFPNFALATNATILVRLSNTNSATSGVTLNVNSTGAKSIYIGGNAWSTSNQLNAGDYLATYDGTYWKLTRIYLTDTADTHRN